MNTICGYGASSEVFRTKDGAVKVFSRQPSFIGIKNPMEYEIGCRINHPHILHAKGITAKGYLVYEYYPYTLWSKEVLALSLTQRQHLLTQLLSAVAALHEAGYLHLDIKGNNVLVNGSLDHLVLADFGASLYVGDDVVKSSSRDRIVDDLKSPELLTAKRLKRRYYNYTRSSDLWALGLLCLEIFQGEEKIYNVSSIEEIWTLCKARYKDEQNKLAYLGRYVPNVEWIQIISNLLTWKWNHRRVIKVEPIPISIFQSKEKPFTVEVLRYHSEIIKTCFHYILKHCDHEMIEAFFLAISLYKRNLNLGVDEKILFITCFWLSLKLVEGLTIDIRELDIEDNNFDKYRNLELKIILNSRGCLYAPTWFTEANCIQDLLSVWNKFLISPSPATFKREGWGKNSITIRLFAYYLGLYNI